VQCAQMLYVMVFRGFGRSIAIGLGRLRPAWPIPLAQEEAAGMIKLLQNNQILSPPRAKGYLRLFPGYRTGGLYRGL
jgi:hypothetical protein